MKQISDLKVPKVTVKEIDIKELFFGKNNNGVSVGASENISFGHYPSVCPRKRHAYLGKHGKITAVMPEGRTARIENGILYDGKNAVQGEYFSEYFEHRLLKVGSYLAVMPDGFYYNLENTSDYGTVAKSVSFGNIGVGVTTVDRGLNVITEYTVLATKPSGALDGHLWAKPREDGGYEMMVYEGHEWYPYESYVRLSAPSLMGSFRVGDVLECTGAEREIGRYIKVAMVDEGGIYVKGAAPHVEKITGLTVKRPMPVFQHVVAASGRAVGVYCGTDASGRVVSYARASAPSDPVLWSEYGGGMSLPLYCGGAFTAITEYRGDVLAFREGSIVRIKISDGKMTFTEQVCEGVCEGEEKSVVSIGDTVYYKGISGIWAYDGGVPKKVSGSLSDVIDFSYAAETAAVATVGDVLFPGVGEPSMPISLAPAGACNGGYYVALKGKDGKGRICVFDPSHGVWCIENDPGVTEFFCKDGALLATVDDGDGSVITLWDSDTVTSGITEGFGGRTSVEDAVSWSLQSEAVLMDVKNGRKPTRVFLKMSLENGALVRVGCLCNGETLPRKWVSARVRKGGYFELPIPATRCESLSICVKGRGNAEIYGCEIEYSEKD